MDLSEKEQAEFEKAVKCYVCAEKFGLNKNNLKNHDHCLKSGLVFLYNGLNIFIYNLVRIAELLVQFPI
jgi:hypothetical protein